SQGCGTATATASGPAALPRRRGRRWRGARWLGLAVLSFCALASACRRDASPHLENADRLLALGENKQAIVEYQNAINVEPSARAQRGLGLAYEALSAFAESQRHLETALEAKPGDVEALVALARVYTRFGQYEKAREKLLAALEQDPNHDPAILLLGVYAETRAQIQQAVDLLDGRAERDRQSGRSIGLESQLVLVDLMARLNLSDAADKLRENLRYLPLENLRLALDLARASQERDNFELSRALLLPLVERDPNNADAWQALAAAALELGKLSEARDAMKHLGARQQEPGVRLLQARLGLSNGKEAESTAALRALLADLPPDLRQERLGVRHVLSLALMDQRKLDEAEAALRANLEEDSQNIESSLTLARLQMLRGRPEQAVSVLSALTDHHGRLARAYLTLGEAQLQASRLDLAEQAFRRLWELAPHEPDARYWLAMTLRRRGQTDQARRLLDGNLKRFATHTQSLGALVQILEETQGANAAKTFLISYGREHEASPEVAHLEGQWLLDHRDPEHALIAFRRSLANSPAFLPAATALSRFYARHERGQLAQAVIDAALAHSPEELSLFLLAAHTASDLRRYDLARDYCERALAVHPGHPLALAELAALQAEGLRDLPRAKQLADQAYAAAPSSPEVLDALGWVTHLSGDPQGALGHLETASGAQPENAQFIYHWGAALLAAGQPAAAKQKLSQVLKLDPLFPTAREIRVLLARP
ncbi:MAG TPA: tetratricopeptide repeat protein, partial [Polyangiaceae bacterium]|nr:tetratricopeptide repeat protein [Polyangiaceae bacterium]